MQQDKITHLNPNDIVVDISKNVREESNYGEVDFYELKESIKSQGVKQPIYVFQNSDGKYEVAHGFRRVVAIQFLLDEGFDVQSVPAIEVEENSEEILLDHLLLNYGKPLTQLEQSSILKELSDKGISNKDIAEKTGIQYQKVTYLVRFRKEAIQELIDEIKNDNIQFTVALQILREVNKEGVDYIQKELLDAARNKAKLNGNIRITVNDVQEVVDEWLEDQESEVEKEEQEKESEDKVEKETNAKSDGEVSVESETEEDEVDEEFPEQKTSNETDSDEGEEDGDEFENELEFDMETYMWDFTKYIESRKGEIKGSAGFFDKNQFIQTLEYIQKNIEDKSFEQMFNEIFVKND